MVHTLEAIVGHTLTVQALMVSLEMVLASGCDISFVSPTAQVADRVSAQSTPTPHQIDAGLKFAGQFSFFAIALQDFGIEESDHPLSVKSSCECVVPSIIEYARATSKVGKALRLDFTDGGEATHDRLLNLSVIVTLTSRSGDRTTIHVPMAETQEHRVEARQSTDKSPCSECSIAERLSRNQ